MKEFFKKIWTWIKGLFRNIKVIDKDQWNKILDKAKEQGVDVFDKIDTDGDSKITAGELKDYIKSLKK